MKIVELNHVAIHVADVEASRAFFREVLRLEGLPRPAFTFPGAWFRLGTAQELHLIGDRAQAVASHRQGNHFALLVEDLDDWEKHFRQIGYNTYLRKLRPDGAGQIFIEDPDGHVIELCSRPPNAQ